MTTLLSCSDARVGLQGVQEWIGHNRHHFAQICMVGKLIQGGSQKVSISSLSVWAMYLFC
jgi:hypothetical protein